MGLGSSRKIAEQNAAFLVLEKLGVAETLDE
jgi:dsRNA-specific ribonuclease